MMAVKLLVKIAVMMMAPGGTPVPPEARGREPPSFFFFFLDLLTRWEKGFPSCPWSPWRGRGESPSEIGFIYMFFFCFTFLFSGPSLFLKFPEIRNSNWAELSTRFLSGYWLSCGERRAPTTLWENLRQFPFGLRLIWIFCETKRMQQTGTGTGHWINMLVPKIV